MIEVTNVHSLSVDQSPVTMHVRDSELQEQRNKISQYIQDNYEVVISNVKHLDQAQVICLGEKHFADIHRRINAQIVDQLYFDKTVLLVEKSSQTTNENSVILNFGKEFDVQAKYVTQSIAIQGWDTEENASSLRELRDFIRNDAISIKPEVAYFISQKKELPGDAKNRPLTKSEKIKKFFSCCSKVCCVGLFIKSCTPCIKKYYKKQSLKGLQKTMNEMPVRNQRMCDTIEEAFKTNERVFVMAGDTHFLRVEQGEGAPGIDYTLLNASIDQTYRFLEKRTFAILIPRPEHELALPSDVKTNE